MACLRCPQIVVEEFLEDINNMLNSGEVPNLFEKDELEQVLAATRPRAKEAGIAEGNRDEVHNGPCQIHPSRRHTPMGPHVLFPRAFFILM